MKDCWYANGLQVDCVSGCTQCCGDGFVLLTKEDVEQLAKATGHSEPEFREQYVGQSEGRYLLKMQENRRCPFVVNEGCLVYGARPVQCRTFPMWPEYVRDLERWKMAAARCPGVGKGRLHTRAEVEQNMRDVSVARMQVAR